MYHPAARLHQRQQLHLARFTNVANAYSPGNACDVVLVRATYSWTIWFPGLAKLLNANAPQTIWST